MPSPTGPHSQTHELLLSRIQARTARIGIIGLGYVGLPLTLLFTEAGFPVTGFDIDPEKVKALNNGRSYIYRIPETEIAAAAAKGFWATDEYSHIKDMDAIIICVPTPLNENHEPDLSYIGHGNAIAPHVRPDSSWCWRAQPILEQPKRSWCPL